MATYYVYSGATGTGDGSSYTNAVTTFAAGVAKLAAGDSLLVQAGHTESTGAATTYTFPGTNALPNIVVATDASSNPTPMTGSITTAGLTIAGTAYFNGMSFISSIASSSAILVNSSTGSWQKYVNGAFSLTSTGTAVFSIGTNGGVGRTEWSNVTVKFAGAGNSLKPNNNFSWKNTAAAVSGVVPTSLFTTPSTCLVRLEALDLSFVTTTIVGATTSGVAIVDIKDCKIAAAAALTAAPTTIGPVVQTSRTDSSGTNYKTNYITYRGTQSTETTVVRTGGASDGTTPVSWKLATNAGVSWPSNFEPPPVVIWNSLTGSTRNVTLHGIVNAATVPNNDQIWFDVEYLSDAASGMGFQVNGTKANVLATGTALATDTTSAYDSVAAARANSTAYTVNQVYKAASNPGRIFFCTTAGTSASSEPAGIATATDGTSVTDGTATFRAGFRFQQTVSITAAQAGYIYVYPKVGAASATYWLDPLIALS